MKNLFKRCLGVEKRVMDIVSIYVCIAERTGGEFLLAAKVAFVYRAPKSMWMIL
jgi:hypothetical protein